MQKIKDFKIITTRGSGPGGQHKNKVESCVEIIHIPSGMSERCQETRSQFKNKEIAMKRLLVKLHMHILSLQNEITNIQRVKLLEKRIRTYNYKTGIVTNHLNGNKAPLNKILSGNIELIQ